jgi:hypothetical protein
VSIINIFKIRSGVQKMTVKESNKELKREVKKPGLRGDDKTAKIPKPLKPGAAGDKKVVLNSGADSAIRPSDATRIAPSPVAAPPGAEETVQMDKSDIKDVPKIASIKKETDDSTKKTVKPPAPISKTAKSKTIKLKPLKPVANDEENQEETLSMDRGALLDKDMPSSLGSTPPKEGTLEDEDTIKIQKPTSTKPAHPSPAIPGAKETIKLRPSNATPPAIAASDEENQETISMSKKTIRLVPKKPSEMSNDATQKTAKPSAPTVKLGGPAPAAAPPPAPAAAPPSAPTVKLPEPAAEPPAASGKRTLKLKSSAKTVVTPPPGAAAAPPLDATEPDASTGKPTKEKEPKNVEKSANPGIIFTIAAFFTLVLMAYYAWMAIGQWAEGDQDMTKNASVPGLSGTVRPPR